MSVCASAHTCVRVYLYLRVQQFKSSICEHRHLQLYKANETIFKTTVEDKVLMQSFVEYLKMIKETEDSQSLTDEEKQSCRRKWSVRQTRGVLISPRPRNEINAICKMKQQKDAIARISNIEYGLCLFAHNVA